MEDKNKVTKIIKDFRIKNSLEGEDENIIVTIHLINTHSIDKSESLDNSSRSGNDHGIDGWNFNKKNGELDIYQSKLSESKTLVLGGLNDLLNAKEWIEKILIEQSIEKIPSNPCLYNLYMCLANNQENIKKINFILISLFNSNELEDEGEYDETKKHLINSKLNIFMLEKGAKIDLRIGEYNTETSLPSSIKRYPIEKIDKSDVPLRKNSHLELAYIPLYSLVELYRQRGDILFEKNIRLSIIGNKQAKARLVHPMENTFDLICKESLDPNIFPFYHGGVTIAATSYDSEGKNTLLEYPLIINGCQTITIADGYLRNLEKEKNEKAIDIFKQIKVIAKVVIGTSDDELREITNSNNRQNPIENWQLFSNDPIHIEIELALKELGVFYERQKGKFESVMTHKDSAKYYINTNNTYMGVVGSGDTIVGLGQIICLSRRNLQWAAKPSEIFINKKNHDSIFDRSIPSHGRDIILVTNLYKASKRALYNYLNKPTHLDDTTHKIFTPSLVKHYTYYLALINFYQAKQKFSIRKEYSTYLSKIANATLVDEIESFYFRVISKIKNWYLDESKRFKNKVSDKSWNSFIDKLGIELGLDIKEGDIPFTKKSIDWSKYKED